MCAIRRAAEADEMAYGLPGAAPVVAVDVTDGASPRVPSPSRAGRRTRSGTPAPLDQAGQRVVEVQREDQRAVDVAAGEIAGDARVVVAALGEQQDELGVVGGQFLADAAQLQGEEGVGEDPGLRFGDRRRRPRRAAG